MAVKEKKRVQVQIDKELADNTEAVLSQLGLNPTTAILPRSICFISGLLLMVPYLLMCL